MKSRILLFCLSVFISTMLNAGDIFNDYQMQPEVHHIIKPQYGEVDARGDLNLSIPVMTVPGRNGLDFPIVFSYHSGITVFQHASWIGLGWSWDPGSITRDVKGSVVADGNVMGVDFPETNPDEYVHDIYYVHLDGGTTPFYEDFGDPLDPYSLLIPSNDFFPNSWNHWKIEFDEDEIDEIIVAGDTTSKDDYGRIIVTKNDGTRYIFEEPTLASYKNFTLQNQTIMSSYTFDNYVSVWRLKAILAPDYDDQSGTDLIPSSDSPGGWIKFHYHYGADTTVYSFITDEYGDNENLIQLTYLDTIETPTHKAVFEISKRDDKDLEVQDHLQVKYDINKKLDIIKLYSKHDTNLSNPIKTIKLDHDQIAESTGRGKTSLDSLIIMGTDTTDSLYYTFDYFLKESSAKDAKDFFNYDDFGYYNTCGGTPGNNFSNDTSNAKAWSLKEIVYPSGGSEEFVYSNDEISTGSIPYYDFNYSDGSPIADTAEYEIDEDINIQGGVRVRKIIRNDSMGNEYSYRYAYASGAITAVPPFYFVRENQTFVFLNLGASRSHSSVYYGSIQKSLPDGSYNTTSYSAGTWSHILKFAQNSNNKRLSILQDNSDWNWGKVKQITHYDKDDNVVKKITNTYYPNTFSEIVDNSWYSGYDIPYKLGFQFLSNQEIINAKADYRDASGGGINGDGAVYKDTEYYYKSSYRLFQKFDIGYDGSDEVRRVTEYEYAHEKYQDMEDKNMLSQVARENSYYVDMGNITSDTSEVSAIAVGNEIDKDSTTFTVSSKTLVSYWCELISTALKVNGYFEIKKGNTRIIYHYGRGEFSSVFYAQPGYTYKVIACAESEDLDEVESCDGYVAFGNDNREYYSSAVTTWDEFDIDESYSFWKPDCSYIWKDDTTAKSKPSFNGWNSTPSDSRWLLTGSNVDYDKHGQLIEKEDAKGNSTLLYYGDNSHNRSNTNAHDDLFHAYLTGVQKEDLYMEFDYDSTTGLLKQVKDANNNSTYYYYDDFGRLDTVKNSADSITALYEYYYSLYGNNGIFNNSDPNYVKTKLILDTLNSNDTLESVAYFDGLGREIQSQVKQGNDDIITKKRYDALDRQVRTWKPYLDSDSDHEYEPDDSINAKSYYSSSGAGPDADGYPYTENEFYEEGLDRVKYVYPPGSSFRGSPGDHYLKYFFEANATNEVTGWDSGKLWKNGIVDENGNTTENYSDKFGQQILTRKFNTGELGTRQFSVSADTLGNEGYGSVQAEDEIDNITVEFEQDVSWSCTLEVQIMGSATGNAKFIIYELATPNPIVIESKILSSDGTATYSDTFRAYPDKYYRIYASASVDGESEDWAESDGYLTIDQYGKDTLDTYFDYDLAGNLIKVTNPEDQLTEYRFNTLGQMIGKATPDFDGDGDNDPTDEDFTSLSDCDIRYKYDKNGNLRFVQDANHRKGGDDLLFYQYDEFNRMTIIGEASLDDAIPDWDDLDPDVIYDYTDPILEIKLFEDIETYTGNIRQQFFYDGDSAYTGANNLKTRISCIKYNTDTQWSYTYYSYTDEGWIEWIVQDVMGIEKKIKYEYDLQGNITKTIYDAEGTDRFYVRYDYNNLGQLSKVYSSLFYYKPTYPDATYEYWPTGAVKQIKLGQNGERTNDFAEILDYTYNTRDWLTSINAPDGVDDIDFSDPDNNFAMHLYYNTGDGIPYYNGNISVADYFTHNPQSSHSPGATTSHFHRYLFEYDKISRLMKADFNRASSGGTFTWLSSSSFDLPEIKYDDVGNITSLIRNDDAGSGDSLNFNYESSTNRLDWVENNDYSGTEQSSDNYVYDYNGNLIEDHVKSITSSQQIIYDYRNLPTYVEEQDDNNSIYYAYDFNGNRIYKYYDEFEGSNNDTKRYYLRGKDGNTLAVYDKNKNLIFYNLYGLDLIGRIVK